MSLSQSFSQKIGNVRPLNPCPSLDIDFANGGYVNTGGFANQESVGSANFKIGAFNGPDPIFTRSSAATFRGSNGLIQYAPENLLSYSEQFDDAYWNKGSLNTTGTPTWINAAVAPNGIAAAEKLIPNTSPTSHYINKTAVTGVTGLAYTASIYAKQAEYRYIGLSDATTGQAVYDLQTGATISSDAGITAYPAVNVGNGWWRLSISFTASTSRGVGIYVWNNATKTTFAGDGTSGIYIWGAQLERSSTVRPYISTTTAARYGPRFEYDLSGNKLGLLMEEQSQNLLSYSEQFNNTSAWTTFTTTVSPNAAAAPNGTTTADALVESSGTFGHSIYSTCSTAIGQVFNTSIFIKANGRNFAFLRSSDNAVSLGVNVISINLVDGTAVSAFGSPSNISCVPVANGFFRVSFSFTSVASTSRIEVIASTDGVYANRSYAGDITKGIYIWGAQLEQKPFATSYMPTVGGPMTRNADVVNSTIGSWYNADEGTIVVKGDRTGFNIQDSLFEFTSGTTASLAHRDDGTDENFLVEDATTNVTIVETIPLNSPLYFAASYSDPATQVNATVNAVPVQGTTLASTITTPTTLNIGYSPEISTYFNGHIKAFRYYAKALPSRLESFTLTA